MSIDREYWKKQFADYRWEDIFKAMGVAFKNERGGKILPRNEECHGCLFLDGIVCYHDKTFRCRYRWCGVKGEMIDYIINYVEDVMVNICECLEDDNMQEFLDRLPKIPDPRQMRFFWSKKWCREWAYHF